MKKVAVLMGSEKDLPIMQKAAETLERFGIPHDVLVASAHKSLDQALAYIDGAEENNLGVIIAGAGKAAHLAGVMAARTTLPVIGVPLSASMDGLDALLSTVQMPSGIPVATVAVDGAGNAALLAVSILAITDDSLRKQLAAHRDQLAKDTFREVHRG
ncbi:MAG: 5-(carboxyamino)imidazole ribonucleotide mutase [Acidimicrobiia bacterium]|nr:5-(carboxyamino)imidazole ribonucleotide mutase [Acidimicrobiia bacterium]NNF09710.1 5-(carboxyamino)imidazole ribonucleotide mutase [Acidimicrobiia bacterium]NNL71388.1 5-(carboxyamino)imidazole ribonucleotide mutase [Acidimicrobiia bacterium]